MAIIQAPSTTVTQRKQKRLKIILALQYMKLILSINAPVKKIPRCISILTGIGWFNELYTAENEDMFVENFGMRRAVFVKLEWTLEAAGILADTRWVTGTEQLVLLLYALITGLSNRKLQNRFQRGAATVSR